jgi:putative oxygen-independent coproporphyrinogen III oxidase
VAELFGVYVHIPFCASRCDYCAFATWTDRAHLIEDYVAAVREDIRREYAEQQYPVATSIFFGGGTPSLINPALLVGILDDIPHKNDAEITVECNPDTVTKELLQTYFDAGIRRISLGVQSMIPKILAVLGRHHNPENVSQSVAWIKEIGFDSFNLDLIYGSVGESQADWEETLQHVLALDPPHVSAYALTVEPGTPLADDPARYPDDDVQAEKYIAADTVLPANGLVNYEISNWARPGHECRHNQLYWDQGNYLGVGSAAHSHRDGRRWWRIRTPERYIDHVRRGESTEAASETLDAATRTFERLELSLRTNKGVPKEALPVDELEGFVEIRDDRAVLTQSGRLMANEIALRLPGG